MRSMFLLLSASMLIGSACSNNDVNGPETDSNRVDAVGVTAWNPTPITITAGEAVTFRNSSSTVHNVKFDQGTAGHPADVADFANASKSVTFATAGTYAYHCGIHPAMQGTVIVQP
jgi:plastocyanin